MSLVSVIIPIYNRLDYISEAIESVLSQTYGDYEIIALVPYTVQECCDLTIKAFDLAEKAKELADSAPMREVPEEQGDEKFNWSLAIGIVLLVTILALAYLKRDVVRRFTGKYTKTSQWHKIYEIGDYINLIRPIITNMKNEKYETKLLEIEGMKDEADRMLKDNNPLAGEQIQLAVDALIKLKKDVEGR